LLLSNDSSQKKNNPEKSIEKQRVGFREPDSLGLPAAGVPDPGLFRLYRGIRHLFSHRPGRGDSVGKEQRNSPRSRFQTAPNRLPQVSAGIPFVPATGDWKRIPVFLPFTGVNV
jgi:hypothetical protein